MHNENACYYCVVGASDAGIEDLENNYKEGKITRNDYNKRILAYYRGIGREKNSLVKLSDYINRSAEQY